MSKAKLAEIKDLIAEAHLKEALNKLETLVKQEVSLKDYNDAVILFKNRIASFNKDEQGGILLNEVFEVKIRKLTKDLLNFTTELESNFNSNSALFELIIGYNYENKKELPGFIYTEDDKRLSIKDFANICNEFDGLPSFFVSRLNWKSPSVYEAITGYLNKSVYLLSLDLADVLTNIDIQKIPKENIFVFVQYKGAFIPTLKEWERWVDGILDFFRDNHFSDVEVMFCSSTYCTESLKEFKEKKHPNSKFYNSFDLTPSDIDDYCGDEENVNLRPDKENSFVVSLLKDENKKSTGYFGSPDDQMIDRIKNLFLSISDLYIFTSSAAAYKKYQDRPILFCEDILKEKQRKLNWDIKGDIGFFSESQFNPVPQKDGIREGTELYIHSTGRLSELGVFRIAQLLIDDMVQFEEEELAIPYFGEKIILPYQNQKTDILFWIVKLLRKSSLNKERRIENLLNTFSSSFLGQENVLLKEIKQHNGNYVVNALALRIDWILELFEVLRETYFEISQKEPIAINNINIANLLTLYKVSNRSLLGARGIKLSKLGANEVELDDYFSNIEILSSNFETCRIIIARANIESLLISGSKINELVIGRPDFKDSRSIIKQVELDLFKNENYCNFKLTIKGVNCDKCILSYDKAATSRKNSLMIDISDSQVNLNISKPNETTKENGARHEPIRLSLKVYGTSEISPESRFESLEFEKIDLNGLTIDPSIFIKCDFSRLRKSDITLEKTYCTNPDFFTALQKNECIGIENLEKFLIITPHEKIGRGGRVTQYELSEKIKSTH